MRKIFGNQEPGRVLVGAALLLCACFSLVAPFAAAEPGEDVDLGIALSKDAFWYATDGTVRLSITLGNPSSEPVEDVSIRIRLYNRNTSRSDLDSYSDGTITRTSRFTETVRSRQTLNPGNTLFVHEVDLGAKRTGNGVFPLKVEALRSGAAVAEALTDVVALPMDDPGAFPPLKFSVVFDVLQPPNRGPSGYFRDNRLAEDCSRGGADAGWYVRLLEEVQRWENLKMTFSLSPFLLEEMVDMADGYTVVSGKEREEFSADSEEAGGAAYTVETLRRISGNPRFQFLAVPYASPNLERMLALGWQEDARAQLDRGRKSLEDNLETGLSGECFFPPGMLFNSRAAAELEGDIGGFLLLGPELLERSAEGRRLSRGLALGYPVEIERGDESTSVALFADDRLQKLVRRVRRSDDPHEVVQMFVSELASLYLERPARERVSAFVWPPDWRPSRLVLSKTMEALAGAPWLETVSLGEAVTKVPPVEDAVLEIPEGEGVEQPGQYFQEVGEARESYRGFLRVVFEDNPRLPLMLRNLQVAQSDVWRQLGKPEEGLGYARAVLDEVKGELAGVEMPGMSSLTLTSDRGHIPITIINGTGYRMRATLALSGGGLSFPDGNRKEVVLEPKENIFQVRVEVRETGRFPFSARLESDGLVLGRVDILVSTGRFSLFAIALVGALLGMILLYAGARVFAGRKVGRHKKGRPGPNSEE